MTATQKLDARLAPVLAAMSAHGIAVRRTLDAHSAGPHAAMIRAELAARFPAGLGSYVLWAPSGDAYVLHCSDASVAEAVTFACRAAGIATTHAGTVVTARPAAASSGAVARRPSGESREGGRCWDTGRPHPTPLTPTGAPDPARPGVAA